MLVRREIGCCPLGLERERGGGGKVVRRFGVAALAELIECPGHARRTDIQAG